MYLFLCLHLLIISDLLFSMLSSLLRVIANFSLRHRRHCLELWLYDFWVTKISQDMFGVFLADIILQYSFDRSVCNQFFLKILFDIKKSSKTFLRISPHDRILVIACFYVQKFIVIGKSLISKRLLSRLPTNFRFNIPKYLLRYNPYVACLCNFF